MAHIEFIDQTLRDGQQSLWGMRMQAGMALPVAPLIDRVGYRVVDLHGSSLFEVLIRHCREDPWEGLTLLAEAMPNSRCRAGMRSNACVTFGVTPDCLMDLWVRQLCEHGIRSFWIYDVLFNIDKMHRLAKVAHEYDAQVALTIMYALSPVHTDEYYADKAEKLAESPYADTILLYDTAGALAPERVRTLVPAIRERIRGKPLELLSHNITGTAPRTYLEAMEHGVHIVHTASRPLANGASIPSIQAMSRNVRLSGHSTDIDSSLLPRIEEHFRAVAKVAGFSVGVPNEYDLFAYEHQVPGGMMGTFRNQLAQHGMEDRLDDVLHETAVVRAELGYPGMATPFSQLVGIQAVLNITTGERYSVIPDEVIMYALGYYGEPVAPIQPEILDRILSAPRVKALKESPPEQPTLEEVRRQYGAHLSDEDLILHALVPAADIEKMRAAGPVRRDYPTLSSPELQQVHELMRGARSKHVELRTERMSLLLRRD